MDNLTLKEIPGSVLKIERRDNKLLWQGMMIFRTTCSCDEGHGVSRAPAGSYFDLSSDSHVIAGQAQTAGTNKAVIIGGCQMGSEWVVGQVKQAVASRGVSLVWIGYRSFGDSAIRRGESASASEFINFYLGLEGERALSPNVDTWQNALQSELVFPHMIDLAEKFKKIYAKIKAEKAELIANYPIVRPVKSFCPVPSEVARDWFGQMQRSITTSSWAVGFSRDRRHCKVWAKSGSFKFDLVQDPAKDHITDKGFYYGFTEASPLIVVDNQNVPFKLTTAPGIGVVKAHPALDPLDPGSEWVSLGERIESQYFGVHEGPAGKCVYCGEELPSPYNTTPSRCLALARLLEEKVLAEQFATLPVE